MSQQQTFEILEVQTREYSRFNTRGTQWKVPLNPPPPTTALPDTVTRFVDSVNNLFDYVSTKNSSDTIGNRNKYQEYFPGGKGGRCLGLTILPPSYADCLEIQEP